MELWSVYTDYLKGENKSFEGFSSIFAFKLLPFLVIRA